MRIKIIFILLFILLFMLAGFVYGAIPPEERAALIALYNSTNGDDWTNRDNWKENHNESDGFSEIGSEATWYGISVSHNYETSDDYVKSIDLNNNNLVGKIPAELGNIKNLSQLYLSHNWLSDSIPAALGNLKNLKMLYLLNNQLAGSIPAELGNLSNLSELSLVFNQLSGEIPAELGNLKKLKWLYLYYNQLTGSIPAALGKLTYLEELSLNNNQLSGNIPLELGNLIYLKKLYLSSNNLTGSIPVELCGLEELTILSIGSNNLDGSILPGLNQLTNLEILNLGNNLLEGSIPSSLGDLKKLLILRLNSNRLRGSIPAAIGYLPKLLDELSDFRWNALYTNDESFKNFLNLKQAGGIWETTQTIALKDVNAQAVSGNSVEVSWKPILYSYDPGGYEVFYSLNKGGPYTMFDDTDTKNDSRLKVTGLNPLTPYYFVVQTRTDPHQHNKNTVCSEKSAEVNATTLDSYKIISGRVATEGGAGVEEVRMIFHPSNRFVRTRTDGNYSTPVSSGWSGTVEPSKHGYTFNPEKISFTNITVDQPGTNFIAIPIYLEISGKVTSASDEGIGGVLLKLNPAIGSSEETETNPDGTYKISVPLDWTGTVTPSKKTILSPSKPTLLFSPGFIEYSKVTKNTSDQDYRLKILIILTVTREEDKTAIIKKDYGKINLIFNLVDTEGVPIEKFTIYRKVPKGAYIPIKDFPRSGDKNFFFEDKYLAKNETYTYMAGAFDGDGNIIGESSEITIVPTN